MKNVSEQGQEEVQERKERKQDKGDLEEPPSQTVGNRRWWGKTGVTGPLRKKELSPEKLRKGKGDGQGKENKMKRGDLPKPARSGLRKGSRQTTMKDTLPTTKYVGKGKDIKGRFEKNQKGGSKNLYA